MSLQPDELTAVRGGADYMTRVSAIASHHEIKGIRIGNRIGDWLGLPGKGERRDNLIGRVGGYAGFAIGALRGYVSAVINPRYGNRLAAQYGPLGELSSPERR